MELTDLVLFCVERFRINKLITCNIALARGTAVSITLCIVPLHDYVCAFLKSANEMKGRRVGEIFVLSGGSCEGGGYL